MTRKLIESYYEENMRLLPCPWCGKNEYNKNPPFLSFYIAKNHVNHYSVSCACCGAEFNNYDETKDAAIKSWNTRYGIDSKEDCKIMINEAINALKKIIE